MNTTDKKNILLGSAIGVIPVTWAALIAAPYMRNGLLEHMDELSGAFRQPFQIRITENTLRTILFFLVIYAVSIGIWLSIRRNYRRGEEHGSAKWGDPKTLNKRYADRIPENNKLLTRNVRIGLNGRKHRRNLNVMVIGGSGAGKTRFYCKPNVMQCGESSLVVLDPKGQLKYARALNLPLKFTYFRERRWQKWLNLRLYGILPSTSDSLKMMNLRVNLTVFPIRKST